MIGGLAAIGFTLGTSLVVALHVDNPTASLIAGIIGAIVLAIVAWRLDLPGLILVILTVLTGASVTTWARCWRSARSAHRSRAGDDHRRVRGRLGLVRAVRGLVASASSSAALPEGTQPGQYEVGRS